MPIDYKEYHPEWKTKIRPDILERDNHCCNFCGVKNHSIIHRFGKGRNDWQYWPEGMESEAWTLDGLKSTKIILTIAHLDHNKKNNEYDNLAALCQKCHLGIDLHHHMANARETRIKKKGLQKLF
jgi:5-methylcytosine-specific restriction endonuclease McrA